MNRKFRNYVVNLLRASQFAPPAPVVVSNPTQHRLAEARAILETIDLQRARGQDSPLGRVMENRIIWRESLELELQQVDEQIERIASAAQENWKS